MYYIIVYLHFLAKLWFDSGFNRQYIPSDIYVPYVNNIVVNHVAHAFGFRPILFVVVAYYFILFNLFYIKPSEIIGLM